MITFEHKGKKATLEENAFCSMKIGDTVDMDFEGHYLIQYEKVSETTLRRTGSAIDGYGNPIAITEESLEV